MKTIAALKQDLDFSRSLGDIIEVLKTAAIIQFRSFQLKDKPNADFIREVSSCLKLLAPTQPNHPYFSLRPDLPTMIVIVTSNEGFLGELNTLLINSGLDLRKSQADEIVVLGDQGAKYLEDMGLKFKYFTGFSEEADPKLIEAVRAYLLNGFLKNFGSILIVYPKFFSLTVQRIDSLNFLPFYLPPAENSATYQRFLEGLLVEPDAKKVIDIIMELWAGFNLLDVFFSSKQSEYAARIMHLEGSTQELSVLNQRLSFEYFRQVHTLRDRSIREISASKVLLGRKSDG